MAIHFTEHKVHSKLSKRRQIKALITSMIHFYTERPCELHFVFCSDKYLHKINQEFLEHDTYTDIITFDLSDEFSDVVCSEIYISTERVHENAIQLGIAYQQELQRVMLHGALHLCGFKDKSPADKQKMRELEEQWMHKMN